jgi:threonine dehydrogenase-like Zn-dependent dehydrogenase
MGGIQTGDTVVVFGAGPVGLLAARCAWLFGAGRVIVIDHMTTGWSSPRTFCPAEVYNFNEIGDPVVFLKKATDSLARTSASTRWAPTRRAIRCTPCSARS